MSFLKHHFPVAIISIISIFGGEKNQIAFGYSGGDLNLPAPSFELRALHFFWFSHLSQPTVFLDSEISQALDLKVQPMKTLWVPLDKEVTLSFHVTARQETANCKSLARSSMSVAKLGNVFV